MAIVVSNASPSDTHAVRQDASAYALMDRNRRLMEVLEAASIMTGAQKEVASAVVTEKQLDAMIDYAQFAIKKQMAQYVFIIGCFTHLFAIATTTPARKGWRKKFFRRIGISPTQGYRCEDVWEVFGAEFVKDMNSFKAFSGGEPLKLLAAHNAPEPSRADARQMMRDGKEINTNTVKELIQRHSNSIAGSPMLGVIEAPKTKTKSGWEFIGSLVRIRVTSSRKSALPEREALIRELQAAIDALRA